MSRLSLNSIGIDIVVNTGRRGFKCVEAYYHFI